MDEAESYLFGLFEKVCCLRETARGEVWLGADRAGRPVIYKRIRRIETEHYLTEREARRFLLALADGLAVLHAHRILHRDRRAQRHLRARHDDAGAPRP